MFKELRAGEQDAEVHRSSGKNMPPSTVPASSLQGWLCIANSSDIYAMVAELCAERCCCVLSYITCDCHSFVGIHPMTSMQCTNSTESVEDVHSSLSQITPVNFFFITIDKYQSISLLSWSLSLLLLSITRACMSPDKLLQFSHSSPET